MSEFHSHDHTVRTPGNIDVRVEHHHSISLPEFKGNRGWLFAFILGIIVGALSVWASLP